MAFSLVFLHAQQTQQQPVCVVDLSSLAPQGGTSGTVTVFTDHKVSSALPSEATAGANGTVTFLGDHVLAVGMCFKSECNVQTIDVEDARPRVLGTAQGVERYHTMLPHDGGVLLGGVKRGKEKGAILLDRDLRTSLWIPDVPGTSAPGTAPRALATPDALGERIRCSKDGTRLLYDSFTRRVGAAQAAKEKPLQAATMGTSADGDVPNGEMIRVIDSSTGKSCFEWYGEEKLLPPFADHADIDPSGRLAAIMTRDTLAIFRLPDACTH